MVSARIRRSGISLLVSAAMAMLMAAGAAHAANPGTDPAASLSGTEQGASTPVNTAGAGDDSEVENDPVDELPSLVSLSEQTGAFRSKSTEESGFNAFNAAYDNKWQAAVSGTSGKVTLLYGHLSKRYDSGPEGVARGFLADAHVPLGLRRDLSDLRVATVHETAERNHVRLQQTHNGVPVDGASIIVHANKQNRVTMVQNSYLHSVQVVNKELLTAAAAGVIARDDLKAKLGADALPAPEKSEKIIALHRGKRYYVWRITISTQNPYGLRVYHVDAENGAILYQHDEIVSLRSGKGHVFTSNTNWQTGTVTPVTLKNLFTGSDVSDYSGGYLTGRYATVRDYNGNNPYSPTYRFLYDPYADRDWFDATQAYYAIDSIHDWWSKNVISTYGAANSMDSTNPFTRSTPLTVNQPKLCNAYYTPDVDGKGTPGMVFGNENSCANGSEDLALDWSITRHEYTHAMMDWAGFSTQFGGPKDYYGRAMGEGNSDWFSYLVSKNPKIGDVAWAWSPDGYLRDLDNIRMYPRDVNAPGDGVPKEHYTGEIWGGYLYDVYRVLGANALKYIYQSFYYFDPAGGFMAGYPDFFDAIRAQLVAEHDLTGGKTTNSRKLWGTWTSRGLNAWLRSPYSHPSNYFQTGMSGSDDRDAMWWKFPTYKTISTQGNLLLSGDEHEYTVEAVNPGMQLTATVSGAGNGLHGPVITLYDTGKNLLRTVSNGGARATLTCPSLAAGKYIITITGQASAPARGYYDFTVTLR